ncbi:hypothetical protein [Bdellovibrio sp. KM01]|uniref:hypothetical protein n=1 Tax=Bdellovibrio sp. KM01 TaxID=2748865 RepID=UPI0015EA2DC0|nr:hypothetical protein [Bdellovibrio sp. KM01]QLY25637.1 hypothetical protein HW988_00880 [Bdellovibrio sp. KM01]
MSRYHNQIIVGVVFSMFIGLIAIAELSNRKPAPKPISVIDDSKGGFSLAQVLVEQELTNRSLPNAKRLQNKELVLAQVSRLSQSDIKLLQRKAANQSVSAEERKVCVYLLEQAGHPVDQAVAKKVAQAPVAAPKTFKAAPVVAAHKVVSKPAPKANAKVARQVVDKSRKLVKKDGRRLPASSRTVALANR